MYVSTAAEKPKDVFADWLHYPGYRDALINERLITIGLYVESPPHPHGLGDVVERTIGLELI